MFSTLKTNINNSTNFSASSKIIIFETLSEKFGIRANLLTTADIETIFTEYATKEAVEEFKRVYGVYYSNDLLTILNHVNDNKIVVNAMLMCPDENTLDFGVLVEKKIENVIMREITDRLNGIYR